MSPLDTVAAGARPWHGDTRLMSPSHKQVCKMGRGYFYYYYFFFHAVVLGGLGNDKEILCVRRQGGDGQHSALSGGSVSSHFSESLRFALAGPLFVLKQNVICELGRSSQLLAGRGPQGCHGTEIRAS